MSRFVYGLFFYIFCQVSADQVSLLSASTEAQVVEEDVGVVPWAVFIRESCSGVLISPNLVITSAQCASQSYSPILYFGSSRPYVGSQTRMPHRQHAYRAFNARNLRNDIHIFEFAEPVNITDTVYPIKLPTNLDYSESFETYEGFQAHISGWGMANNGTARSFIRTVNVTVISNKECSETKFGGFIRETTICTFGEDVEDNLCSGEAGSGLYFYDEDNEPTLIGIGSFINENGCNVTNATSGFTRITSYLNWAENSVPPAFAMSYALIFSCLSIAIFHN